MPQPDSRIDGMMVEVHILISSAQKELKHREEVLNCRQLLTQQMIWNLKDCAKKKHPLILLKTALPAGLCAACIQASAP